MRSSENSRFIGRRKAIVALAAGAGAVYGLLRTPRPLLIRDVVSLISPTAGAAVGLDQSIEGEYTPTVIQPVKGEMLLPTTKSIVLSLPGQNYRAAPENITALTALSKLGVRMYAELGNTKEFEQELIKDLLCIRDKTGVRTMSWHCNSDSWPIAAQIIPRLSNEIAPDYIFLDDTPKGPSDLKGGLGILSKVVAASGYGPSAVLNSFVDWKQFGTPLASYVNGDAALAVTSYQQNQYLVQSDRITENFAEFFRDYNEAHPAKKIRIVYMRLADPTKDAFVNEVSSIDGFRKELPIYVAIVGGPHQVHDNDAKDAKAANAAILQAIAMLG